LLDHPHLADASEVTSMAAMILNNYETLLGSVDENCVEISSYSQLMDYNPFKDSVHLVAKMNFNTNDIHENEFSEDFVMHYLGKSEIVEGQVFENAESWVFDLEELFAEDPVESAYVYNKEEDDWDLPENFDYDEFYEDLYSETLFKYFTVKVEK
jgi:hypothetical protein